MTFRDFIRGLCAVIISQVFTLSLSAAQNVKSVNGVAIANVKSINGVAKANVKSLNGVDNTSGGGGGTDWTADATMVALYNMNSGAANQDSQQTNHVDDASLLEAPAASAGDKIEGDQSLDFERDGNDDGLRLTYSNATADFPCNGTGDGEVTIAGWVKAESLNLQYMWAMATGSQRMHIDAAGVVYIVFNGSAAVTHTSTATISAGTWYFVAAVYSDANNEIRCYIRAAGAGAFTIETTTANIGTLDDHSASYFSIGAASDATSASCWDGLMDAWAVFNGTAMTQAQLEGVFDNGWDGNGW